uniref:PHD-type domain-containing protein n=1 Tax=Steinernema glaseri TaxID=37863 RepID=A0A1I7Z1Z4_9BILA
MSSLISALPIGANDHLKHLSSPHSLSTVSSPSATSNFSPLHTLNGYTVSGVSPTEASTASSFYNHNQPLPQTAASMEMQPTSVADVKPSFSQHHPPPTHCMGTTADDSTQTVICSPFDSDEERQRHMAIFQKLKNSGIRGPSAIESRRHLYQPTPQSLSVQMQLPYASSLRLKPPLPYPQPISGPSVSRPKVKKETKSRSKNANSRPNSNFSSGTDVKPSPSSSDGFAVPDLKRKAPPQSPSTSAMPLIKNEYDAASKAAPSSHQDRIGRDGDCVHCKKQITNDSPAIRCTALQQGCLQMFHMKCAGLNEHAVDELTRNPNAEWVCNSCALSIRSYKLYRNT